MAIGLPPNMKMPKKRNTSDSPWGAQAQTTSQHPKWGVDTTSPMVPNPNPDHDDDEAMVPNPYYGLPDPASYTSSYDPEKMALSPELDQRLSLISMDKRGLNKFRDEALRSGPSPWASIAKQGQAVQAASARDRSAQESSGQTAQSLDRLGASGGLSSGARERATLEGAKNYLAMSQDTARQENINDLQIGMNDEQNRVQQLSMLPGMELQAIQPEMQKAQMWEQGKASDVQAQVEEGKRKQAYDQWLAEQQQKLYASNQQANATAQSGKKS